MQGLLSGCLWVTICDTLKTDILSVITNEDALRGLREGGGEST